MMEDDDDDDDDDVLNNRWNDWQQKRKYSEKTCSSATLFTTNPKRPNLGHCSGRPVTNCLNYAAELLAVEFLNTALVLYVL
jgi:hypothetical protein